MRSSQFLALPHIATQIHNSCGSVEGEPYGLPHFHLIATTPVTKCINYALNVDALDGPVFLNLFDSMGVPSAVLSYPTPFENFYSFDPWNVDYVCFSMLERIFHFPSDLGHYEIFTKNINLGTPV